MKRFIKKFSLIISLCLVSSLGANQTSQTKVEFNQTSSVEPTEKNATSILDVNVSSILKQPKNEVSEENKTAEKEKIVEILTGGEENKTEEELKVVKMIAEKAVSTSPVHKKPDEESLGTIISAIKDINIKVDLLKAAAGDSNQTSEELKSIETSKGNHLSDRKSVV